jgi:hypothetical protein
VPEHHPSEPDAERSPFDDFVNQHLDLDSLGDLPPDERPALSSPPDARGTGMSIEGDRADTGWRGARPPTLPEGDDIFGGESRASLPPRHSGLSGISGRLPFGNARSSVTFPALDDPRWQRGTFEVVRDLRIHKLPVLAPGGSGIGSNVMVFTNACRYDMKRKRLRYIPNIFPGWSAVHLTWDNPIVGYVHQNEVRLTAYPQPLQASSSQIVLIVTLCLLLFMVIFNLVAPSNNSEMRVIESLNAEIATLQARLTSLEADLATARASDALSQAPLSDGTPGR